MLTLDEIRNVTFEKALFGGYSAEQVDDFIEKFIETAEFYMKKAEQASSSYAPQPAPAAAPEPSQDDGALRARVDALLDENSDLSSENTRLTGLNEELTAKLKVLADEIQRCRSASEDISHYRALEDNMKDIVFASQKAAAGIIDNAKQRAAEIVSEAEKQRDVIASEARLISERKLVELRESLDSETRRLEALRASNTEMIRKVKSFYYAKLHELSQLGGDDPAAPRTAAPEPAPRQASPLKVESHEEVVSDDQES